MVSGIYCRFVLLLDVEVRFDCAGSHKVRCRLLSASVSRGIYRRFLQLDFLAFLGLRGPWKFCLVVQRHGFPANGPELDSRPVSCCVCACVLVRFHVDCETCVGVETHAAPRAKKAHRHGQQACSFFFHEQHISVRRQNRRTGLLGWIRCTARSRSRPVCW